MPKRKRLHIDDQKEDTDSIKKRRKAWQYDASEICQELYDTIRYAKTSEGRLVCESFIRAPKRRNSADYYDIVATPIDLLKIQQKLKMDEYDDLSQMTTDIELMVNNAKMYYKKQSIEYKDACQLWDLYIDTKNQLLNDNVNVKKEESDAETSSSTPQPNTSGDDVGLRKLSGLTKKFDDHSKSVTPKSSERIRAKRLAGSQNTSATISTMHCDSDPDDMEEEEDDDEPPEDPDDPKWQLFNTIYSHTPSGYKLSEPFLKLPSRRLYPDYYKEIKLPISLLKIRGQIRSHIYENINELQDDLNQMFDNAKQYNRPDSRIYKDAVKLQKVMVIKVKELSTTEKEKKEETDEDVVSEEKNVRPVKTPKPKKISTPPTEEKRKSTKKSETDGGLRKRLKSMYKTLLDYQDDNGRPLITLFIEKPSKKDYPDYYQVITEPIDMKTIENNIKSDKYQTEEDLVADFRLMFNNCRQYNEEESQIYLDAEKLEKVLMEKIHDMMVNSDIPRLKTLFKSKTKPSSQIVQKLKTLYKSVKDYTDNKGRKLSVIFMKLPSKQDYPNYYEVIRKPIDMHRIHSRMLNHQYENLEEMLSDYVLMFDNACKYNEPDSQIYKDALTLQRVALQNKVELSEDEDGNVPDVRPLVQELLTTLFTEVYNHQDEEGRCFVDSLAELSEISDSTDGNKIRMKGLTLDMIKRSLDKGRYRRLDFFQDDIFDVFEKARKISRTDSQVFEDSIELQSFFIKKRDELCRNGEVLFSPALRYTDRDLQASVDGLRQEKLPCEKSEDEKDKEQDSKTEKEHRNNLNNSDSVSYREQTYRVGDYAYIEPREKGLEPHIIVIEKLWKDELGEQWLYGCWFYRPNETFHLTTRKFLEKEVFKSDNYNNAPMNQVYGKCHVMFVKDYFKYRPDGFDDKDVYVCESRYSSKAKSFKKIKVWSPYNQVRLIPRDEPLEPVRVPSVFKEKVEKIKDESSDSDDFDTRFTDKDKPNVIAEGYNIEDNITYYEQYNIPAGCFKQGDFVYVQSDNGRQLIARIDRMWLEKNRGMFFHGPWFVTSQEILHPPTRLFFKQEVFLSSVEDTNPLLSITGRCTVLEYKDYISCRPTEILEQHVHVCESRYMEAERQIRKLTKGLKKYALSDRVIEDEIYYFKKPITPQKEPSPLLPKMAEVEMEDSNDGQAPSISSNDNSQNHTVPTVKKKPLRRLVTGYILFASEVRKSIIAKNPESSFGDISRIVGTEWRNLPQLQKTDYEERAQKMNEETAANQPAATAETVAQSPCTSEDSVYVCHWEKCDYQFEDQQDLVEHLLGEQGGHVHSSYHSANIAEGVEFQCLWHNCSRIKKNIPPFPNLQRLLRHCKEVHIKSSMKVIPPADRSKNFVHSRSSQLNASTANYSMSSSNNPANNPQATYPTPPHFSHPPAYGGLLAQSLGHTGHTGYHGPSIPVPQYFPPSASAIKPLEPMFIAVPPKPQRLLHSETYLRYIEGLNPDSRTISNWDASLRASADNTTRIDYGRLPTHWLGNGVGNHGNAVNALWALRDFMLKDALNISKVI